MNKNIIDFVEITSGWLKMIVYDPILQKERAMRISYIQPFFDNLLMACKFLLSDITGTYELEIDQEGFDAALRFHKKSNNSFTLEVIEEAFEDEIPYGSNYEERNKFYNSQKAPTFFQYFNVNIQKFTNHIVNLIEKNKDNYNHGFCFSPADELNEDLLSQVKILYNNFLLGGDEDEEISNT